MWHIAEKAVNPFPDEPVTTPPDGFFAFLWNATRGIRPYLAGLTLFTALIGAFEGFLFGLLGGVVDRLSQIPPAELWTRQSSTLLMLAGVIAGSIFLVGFQTLIRHQVMAGNFPMLLRWRFHQLMLSQSMAFYQDEFAGRIAAKVMQTALAVRDVWFTLTSILVFITIYFVTLMTVVGRFDHWMLVPFLAWLGAYALSLRYFIPRLSRVSSKQADARALMTGRMTDAYSNITTVKLFSHAGREASYARSAMQEFLKTVYAQMRMVSTVEIFQHALSMFLILGATGVALWLWSSGQTGLGAIAAVIAMTLRLNGISHWIMWEMAGLFENVGTVQDGIRTLSTPRTILDNENAVPLEVHKGEIELRNLTFNYDKPNFSARRPILHDLNLKIRPGERIGLIGRSGAGKSTLISLLLRFYDISEGEILIDGQNIALATQDSLRQQIGLVTQDTSLLHRSIAENILYGRPDAPEADMIEAAKRAHAHDFIEQLTDSRGNRGYEAHVGERGIKLSGGQRQRIAIARVMLKNAPILVLDEATSALDSEVEQAIQSSLNDLMKDKTVIAIAHRLSTIMAMDRLIVMDRGQIAEQGSHQELLAKGGLYARLWNMQSGGFIGDEVA